MKTAPAYVETKIQAVDLMAQVRGKPVVLWPVFVMALQGLQVQR